MITVIQDIRKVIAYIIYGFKWSIKVTEARAEQGVVDAAPPIVYCVNEAD
ncbi:hypothetical protein ACNSTQ_20445 [Alkalihalobacterium sp. APHAB7]